MGKTDASLFQLKEEMKSQIKNEIENMGDTLGFVAYLIHAQIVMHLFYAQVEISIFFATVQSERSQTNRESYFETNKKGLENMNSRCHKDRHDD